MNFPQEFLKIKKYIPKIKKYILLFLVLPLIIICSIYLIIFLYVLYDDYKSSPEQVWKSYPLPEIDSCRTVLILSDEDRYIGSDIDNRNFLINGKDIVLTDEAKFGLKNAFLSQLRVVDIAYIIDLEGCNKKLIEDEVYGFYIFTIANFGIIINRLKTSHFYDIMYNYSPKTLSNKEKERVKIKHASLNPDKLPRKTIYIRYPISVDDIEIKLSWLLHTETELTNQKFLEKFSNMRSYENKGSDKITIRSDWYRQLIKNENDSIVYEHSVWENYENNNLITIEWLADYYKTSVEKIRYWNNMKFEDKIQPNDRIKILLPKR